MRASNKKNEKIIKVIFFIIFLILFSAFILNNIRLKESCDLFIDLKSIISMIENNKTRIIYDYIKNRDKVYVYYDNSLEDKTKEYISMHLPSVKYIGSFEFMLYFYLFKDSIMFYACEDRLINKLKLSGIKCCKVVLDIEDIDCEEYLTLKSSNDIKLFLSFTNKEVYKIDLNYSEKLYKYLPNIDKKFIKVADGDTIKYRDNYYRFIGLDAPELKQNYGSNVKTYVENKIESASNINMLVGSYDIFGRILCHLFIDNVPLAYSMMNDRQAKETIMKYGDSGFTVIASNIVYLSKFQGRRPFTDPAKFRSENN